MPLIILAVLFLIFIILYYIMTIKIHTAILLEVMSNC